MNAGHYRAQPQGIVDGSYIRPTRRGYLDACSKDEDAGSISVHARSWLSGASSISDHIFTSTLVSSIFSSHASFPPIFAALDS